MSTQSDQPPEDQVTPAEAQSAEATVGPVSRWAIHRHLYDWVLRFAHKKYSTAALATLSFTESSFFPIPPDVLLMPMCLGNRKKALWYATVCSVASVAGGALGYAIGVWGMDLIGQPLLDLYDPDQKTWAKITDWYDVYGFWGVLAAAVTPIPYKVFTIASGALGYSFGMFMIASAIGRSLRFFLVAGLMWKFGPTILPFIDKYFNLLTIAFTILLVGGFMLVKLL